MSDRRLEDYYAQRAHEYDSIYQKPERQGDIRRLADQLTELLSGRNVLEVACGTGFWTQFFAPFACAVTASDYNGEVLAIAKQRLTSFANVQVKQADAFKLENFDPTFDAEYAGFWWSHLDKKKIRPFLNGFHLALRPGSRMVFTDNLYVEGNNPPISRTDVGGNTYQTRKLLDGRQYEVLKNFPSEDEFRAALVGIGTNISFKKFTYFWCSW